MQQRDSDEERAVALWRELVEGSVECELCNEPYDEEDDHVPRLLSCGHTFCQVRPRSLLIPYVSASS